MPVACLEARKICAAGALATLDVMTSITLARDVARTRDGTRESRRGDAEKET